MGEASPRSAERADIGYRSIPGMALINGRRFGDALAVLDGDIELTFRQVADGMLSVARALLATDIGPNDRVALWAPNSAAWITTALGVLATGARLVPLNTRFKGAEAAYILAKTQSRTLICANGFLGFDYVDMLRQAPTSVPALEEIVLLDGKGDEGTLWEEFLARGHGVDEAAARARLATIGPEDGSDVLFTSGTTGHPKGVMLRHGASLRCYEILNRTYGLGPGDRIMIVTPFFHCFGYKAGWMMALMNGATSVPVAAFDAGRALQMIEELGITHTAGAPTMFWSMLDHPTRPQRDLSTLRTTMASAAYVPAELIDRMGTELGVEAMTGYGLTEAHAFVSVSQPGDPPQFVAQWSGQVIEDTEVRIVDEAGADLGLGEQGELLVRGFQLMDGYYDDPEATAAVIDRDGWLHTGDIAYMNADRYIKICDRKKDMFIVGGFNVAPAEVEGLLLDWDRIAACAIVGIPDHQWGEIGVAFVVPARPGLTPEDVMAWAKEHMANYKVPRRVLMVDALPLNATGKVLKAELRTIALNGKD
jgi:acyl-CoA synthetase (AMP-forming)/AMP-acid ligase II